MAKETVADRPVATRYTKEQLIRSNRYTNRRDLLGAILKDSVLYSIEEVEAMLNNYMKGKVK